MSDTFVRISNWDDDEYNYLSKYEKSENTKKMFNTRLNAHGGFTPAAVASPNAIPPEQVMYDNPRTGNTSLSRSAQGRFGGTGTVPSVYSHILSY